MFKKYLKKYVPLEIVSLLSEIHFFMLFLNNFMQQLKRNIFYMYIHVYTRIINFDYAKCKIIIQVHCELQVIILAYIEFYVKNIFYLVLLVYVSLYQYGNLLLLSGI